MLILFVKTKILGDALKSPTKESRTPKGKASDAPSKERMFQLVESVPFRKQGGIHGESRHIGQKKASPHRRTAD